MQSSGLLVVPWSLLTFFNGVEAGCSDAVLGTERINYFGVAFRRPLPPARSPIFLGLYTLEKLKIRNKMIVYKNCTAYLDHPRVSSPMVIPADAILTRSIP